MSYVEFDEPNYGSNSRFQKKEAWPTRIVMRLGLAKSKEQAPMVLLVITVLAIVVMFVVGFGGGSSNDNVSLPPDPDARLGGAVI